VRARAVFAGAALALAAALPAAAADAALAQVQRRLAAIEHRAMLQQDERDIENLQKQYGYYLDRAMWDQVADLFAKDATFEYAQRGVYVGKARIRKALALFGPEGPQPGHIDDHIMLQVVVHVAPDGKTAKVRCRDLTMGGDMGGKNHLKDGVYENRLVKRGGVWMFSAVHYYLNMSTDFDKGWGKDAQPIETASVTLPPDRPPTEVYQAYPKAHTPPFDFDNPVTGEPIQYSGTFGPEAQAPPAPRGPAAAAPAPQGAQTIAQLEARLAKTKGEIDRVRAYDQIENLESAYGYYLDKNLWDQLADLFARDSTMELAQRGVYVGRDHIRAFLHAFGGAEGPHLNQLGDHLNLQPVILVSPDGKTAKVRARVLQMMGAAGRSASMSGAVYENAFVNEGGVWKYKTDHAYNTWVINYDGGWAKQTRGTLPGPNKTAPPDRPPSLVFEAFPKTFDLPWNYKNPVTGR
jgi:hypothetical protein